MAGIYLHIPFCKQACYYCDFHFSTSLKYREEMLSAMHTELKLQKEYLSGESIETIYFGGGTPSLLSGEEIQLLIDRITQQFSVTTNPEITLEANPDDLDAHSVKQLQQTAVNRLSIGVQSFFEEDLKWMNRAHTAAQAFDSVKRVQDSGIENITLDLIYGYPLLTNEKWRTSIRNATDLGVPHISSYSMTVEPKTALASFINKGLQKPMQESKSADQFRILMELLTDSGFEQYEISNFARDKKYSVHNSNYWKGIRYLGIGPSAHSFDIESRQWNVANNAKYMDSLSKKNIPAEREILTAANKLNEYIMTSLRTIWGMDLLKIEKDLGREYREKTENALSGLSSNSVKREGDIITLTTEGKFFADRIAGELFVN